jgi:putative ABC transport system permease protein
MLSGRLRSALIIGIQGIRARKLRTFLSMISLFLGVLAVVTVQAGAEIGKRALLSDLELQSGKDGTRQMFMPSNASTFPIAMQTLKGRSDAVAMTNVSAIIGEPNVTPINAGGGPFNDDGGSSFAPPPGISVRCDVNGCYKSIDSDSQQAPVGAAIQVRLVALSGDIRQFRPFRLRSGQWLDFGGEPSLSPLIVLNEQAAKGFNRYRVPAEMRVDGATANMTPRILGVVDDAGYEPTAYIRADALAAWMGGPAQSSNRMGGNGVEVLMSPDSQAIEQVLRLKFTANGIRADQIHVETLNYSQLRTNELKLLQAIFLGMAGLVLLIGIAGILNVGLATVGERIEEFALRRALGTPRTLLAGIVLAETLLTGILTAAAAIGAGIVGLEGISHFLGDREPFLRDVTFPWQAGVAGVIAGLVAGILGGLIPAARAARIPIATVMRA